LGDDKQQQVLALGRLGWPLRRIEAATGVRRETASVRRDPRPPASAPPTPGAKSGQSGVHRLWRPFRRPGAPAGLASAGQPGSHGQRLRAYRELIEQALAWGRNAMAIWPDLVDDHGFPGRAGFESWERPTRSRGSHCP
jgi:hypothetical protein